MAVENVDEFHKLGGGVCPDTKNVIQIVEVEIQ